MGWPAALVTGFVAPAGVATTAGAAVGAGPAGLFAAGAAGGQATNSTSRLDKGGASEGITPRPRVMLRSCSLDMKSGLIKAPFKTCIRFAWLLPEGTPSAAEESRARFGIRRLEQ